MSALGCNDRRFDRMRRDGSVETIGRAIAEEVPIAIELNGLGYAVLMATPSALADLAFGFVLAERLADTCDDIIDVTIHEHAAGRIVRIALSARTSDRIAERVRHRTTESACGLCGVENLEQALRDLPPIARAFTGNINAVFAALERLAAFQPLNRATGAVHAAALCDREGSIRLIREDVGRHNALDKLIGAMARYSLNWDGGFALMTSRCSYELVEKAVLAGCPLLATISAPTSLAVARAAEAGLPLVSLARADSLLLAR